MCRARQSARRWFGEPVAFCLLILWLCPLLAHAGGSGLNTVVVVNQASSNSCQLANYFCVSRQVPPQNVLYLNWTNGNTSWSSDDFQTNLLSPLLNLLQGGGLSNQVEYVVLSMDIPFQTVLSNTVNSTTAALFYGLKPDGGTNWAGLTNSYAASELPFSQAHPASAPGHSFLCAMLTSDSLSNAEHLVDQGVSSDGSFPTGTVLLEKTSDTARNLRYTFFDNAIFNNRLRPCCWLIRTNSDAPPLQTNIMGYETGLATYSAAPDTFAPGAVADSMTSFGGVIFGQTGQTSLLAFINAGAAGSYGTVSEPQDDPQKFPNPQVYFYISRGFNLAEAYWQSVNNPYLGLVVAEPLAAPYAQTAAGNWLISSNAEYAAGSSNLLLRGLSPLSLEFDSLDASHPLQQVDLFIDGTYYQTLTNLSPQPGNLLNLSLNGYPLTYVVPTNASLQTLVSDLAALINSPVVSNATSIAASPHGDRLELKFTGSNSLNAPFFVPDPTGGATGRFYQVSYLPDSTPPQMAPAGFTSKGAFQLNCTFPTALPYTISVSTNLVDWQPLLTNVLPGFASIFDAGASNYPLRFYRAGWPLNRRPMLTSKGLLNGVFNLHVDALPGFPYLLQSSSDLMNWSAVSTNSLGGTWDFQDAQAAAVPIRFYRASLVPPQQPSWTLTTNSAGIPLVRVDSAQLPYSIAVSTDMVHWTPISTNYGAGKVQLSVNSSVGIGNLLSTFIQASRPTFLDSEAFGIAGCSIDGSPQVGGWLQFTLTKTNGSVTSFSFTNQLSGAAPTDIANQFIAMLNADPDLQGSDGVVAEDLTTDVFGKANFNIRARSAGFAASAVQIQFAASGKIYPVPLNPVFVQGNLADLQARNHVYLSAGAAQLGLDVLLDTTTMADGYHELSAVAYEGTSVRTQSRSVLPILVSNTQMFASLTFPNATNVSQLEEPLQVNVTANTPHVSLLRLFSTGGLLASATNQSSAVFSVNSARLGAGKHPFYAIVTSSDGREFRTDVRWLWLRPGKKLYKSKTL